MGAWTAASFSSAPLSFADKMQRLCVYVLVLALALATFSEASWKPRSQLQDAPSGPGANRGPDSWLDRLGSAPHQRRQLGLQGPPQLVAGRSCDSRPCLSRLARLGPRPWFPAARGPSHSLTSSLPSAPQTCPRSRDRGWRRKKQRTDGWTSAAAALRKGTDIPSTELQRRAISQPTPAP